MRGIGVYLCIRSSKFGQCPTFGSTYGIAVLIVSSYNINTLRRRQNGCHIANDIFKCIFFNENFTILNNSLLKYAP